MHRHDRASGPLASLAAYRLGVVINRGERQAHFFGDLPPGLAAVAAALDFGSGGFFAAVLVGLEVDAELGGEGAAAVDVVGLVDHIRVAVEGAEVDVEGGHDLLVGSAGEQQGEDFLAALFRILFLRERLRVGGVEFTGQSAAVGDAVLLA